MSEPMTILEVPTRFVDATRPELGHKEDWTWDDEINHLLTAPEHQPDARTCPPWQRWTRLRRAPPYRCIRVFGP